MDLSAVTKGNCGGPVVDFRDGRATVAHDGFDWTYTVMDFNAFRADIDRDGRPDYLVTLGCTTAGLQDDACAPGMSAEACEFQRRSRVVTQLFVLRGEPDDLTAIGAVHVGSYARPPSRVTIDGAGRIKIVTVGSTPQDTYWWAYQPNVGMRLVTTASGSPSASPTG
jgi:hypothetical protein